MATLLEANEVTKIYAKGQRPSLNKVSFNVAESEFIAIMGASGSGKTTLLNVLSTIDTPTSGSIVINGVNLKQLSDTGSADFRRDNLGFIFQEYFLLDSLTIRENISVPLTLQKLPHKNRKNGAEFSRTLWHCLSVRQISKRAVWRAETTSIGGKSHCKTAKYFIC